MYEKIISKPKVLIVAGYFYPGFKSGGPIQSLINMISNLDHYLDFYVLANDRDIGDRESYPETITNVWCKYQNSSVYYTDFRKIKTHQLIRIIEDINPSIIYLNNIFEYRFLSLILKKSIIKEKRIIIAPRGTLSEGALKFQRVKKIFYLKILNLIDYKNRIIFHSTSQLESKQIQYYFKNNLVLHAENIAQIKEIKLRKTKKANELRLIFASRIHPKKNLLFVLKLLKEVDKKIVLDIFGYIDDKKYWEICKNLIVELNKTHHIKYHGFKSKDSLAQEFIKADLFVFPTLGENFGHIIVEALSCGCPVITTNQTPWKELNGNRGLKTIPIIKKEKYLDSINDFIKLSSTEHFEIMKDAKEYIKERYQLNSVIDQYKTLYNIYNR